MAGARKNKKKLSERFAKKYDPVAAAVVEAIEEYKIESAPEEKEAPTSSQKSDQPMIERPGAVKAVKAIEKSNKLEEESLKIDKKLLEAVKSLTASMEVKTDKKPTTAMGGIKDWFSGKKKSVSEMFSLEGIAGAVGVDPSGLLGSAISARAEGKRTKQEERKKVEEFAADYTQFNEKGKALYEQDPMKAVAEAARVYKENEKLTVQIQQLEAKEKRAKAIGGNLNAEDTKALRTARVQQENLGISAKPVRRSEDVQEQPKPSVPAAVEERITVKDTQEFKTGVVEGMISELNSLSPEEQKVFREADPEFLKGVFQGIFEELKDVNEEQLEQLMKLVKLNTKSEEDTIEADRKEDLPTEVAKEAVVEKKKSKSLIESLGDLNPMKKIKDMVPDGLGKIVKGAGKLLPAVGSALSAAGPAAAVAGAGAAGFALGNYVLNPLLNKGAEMMTGQKGETLGGAIYTGVDKIAGIFGASDADKQKEIEKKTLMDLGKKRLAEGKPLSPMLKSALETNRKDLSPEEQKKLDVAPVQSRVAQTATLATTAEAVAVKREEKATPAAAQVINAPTTSVVNNNTTRSYTRIPVRNQEVSYNRKFDRMMVH